MIWHHSGCINVSTAINSPLPQPHSSTLTKYLLPNCDISKWFAMYQSFEYRMTATKYQAKWWISELLKHFVAFKHIILSSRFVCVCVCAHLKIYFNVDIHRVANRLTRNAANLCQKINDRKWDQTPNVLRNFSCVLYKKSVIVVVAAKIFGFYIHNALDRISTKNCGIHINVYQSNRNATKTNTTQLVTTT